MKIFAPHATDFYKTGHPSQNPEGTEVIYANMTARSDRLANMPADFDHKIVVANIQGTMKWMLRDLWNETFFQQPKAKVLDKYKRRMDSSLGEGVVGTDHIAELHDLGYMPLHVKALPEGSRVNIGVPFLTAQNTHNDFKWLAPWLTNYVETAKSSELWKAINVATIAYEFRRLLDHYAEITGSNPQFVDFQGHDFSARGVGGIHDAAAHQIGHLFSFKGTDTILSIDYLEDYYDCGSEFIGGSVPATEHSVTCLGGRENEVETIRRIISKVYPSGVISVVSDTWNYWDTLTVTAPKLKEAILSRKPNGLGLAKVVFRPDSGDPEKIICGDADAEPGSREYKGSLELLWEVFGGTVNEKGFKVLNPRVGLIYGDSITLPRARAILEHMRQLGWASENIVFGIGSYTYQYHTRDTFGIAYKTTWGQINGVAVETMKDPITDRGTKKSALGLLRVEKDGENFVLHQQQTREQEQRGELRTVFLNSVVYGEDVNSLPNIRTRLLNPAA
jgi:nicotinamide phosphoribosyltransferase